MSVALAKEVLQSISVELTFFVVTVALAVAIRWAPFGKSQKSSAAPFKRTLYEENQKVPTSASVPGTSIKRTPPRSALQSVTNPLMQKIEVIVSCANRQQSSEAIAAYEEMKADGKHLAIKDTLKAGKPSAADFYGLLVQCAGKAGKPDLIEVFLDDMKAAGIDRPLKFYESAMKLLASKKCYKEAMLVCTRLEADGLEPSPVTLSCLVNFAAEIGQNDRAIELFHRLAATSTPSIRAYMTILRVYAKRPDWPRSLALIRDMQKRQAPIDSLVLNVALATGVSVGDLTGTTELLREFSQSRIADAVSYNTIMKGCAHQKEVDAALKLLDDMCKAGLKPNAITFNTAMDAAIRGGRVADAWWVLVRMLDAGLSPDKFTCTTLMKGLQSGATSEQLSLILDFLKTVTKDCDSTLCCSLFRGVIEATAQVNDPWLTSKAVAQMREQRVMLSPPEYQRLLKVLLKDGDTSAMQ